ncbi:MAG: EamA family transporter, partial [Clostridiales bacterium]|nr:EamA family transporter [Clostridiales bacterium]
MSKSLIRTTLLPVLAAIIWGMAFVAQTQNTVGTFSCIACRSILAFVFLLAVIMVMNRGKVRSVLSGSTREETKNLWLGGALSGCFLTSATFFQQHGMDLGTDAGKAGFITALYIV